MPLDQDIAATLADSGTPERAAQEKRYLKSELTHYGVTVPTIRATVRDALKAAGAVPRAALLAAVRDLWAQPVHELRAAAVELLVARAPLLQASELDLVERLVREAKTWALVDPLAANVAGPLVERLPACAAALDRWAKDEDFWVRRAAMLALLVPLRQGGGDFERFGRYADAMLEEREFFIRKAIGWVLREVAKRRPALVTQWLLPRAKRASGLTFREATRALPEAQRARLDRARAAARPRTTP